MVRRLTGDANVASWSNSCREGFFGRLFLGIAKGDAYFSGWNPSETGSGLFRRGASREHARAPAPGPRMSFTLGRPSWAGCLLERASGGLLRRELAPLDPHLNVPGHCVEIDVLDGPFCRTGRSKGEQDNLPLALGHRGR